MADKIKIIRGTEGQWLTAEANGKILDLGEIAFITDTNELVVGDGTTTFSSLKRFLNKTQVATIDNNGYMSATDKSTLDNNKQFIDNIYIETLIGFSWNSSQPSTELTKINKNQMFLKDY